MLYNPKHYHSRLVSIKHSWIPILVRFCISIVCLAEMKAIQKTSDLRYGSQICLNLLWLYLVISEWLISFLRSSIGNLYSRPILYKGPDICERVNLTLKYWGTSNVLTIMTPHRSKNDIKPLAIVIIFNSVILLSIEFNTTQLSKPEALSANNRILYEPTVSSPSLTIEVL